MLLCGTMPQNLITDVEGASDGLRMRHIKSSGSWLLAHSVFGCIALFYFEQDLLIAAVVLKTPEGGLGRIPGFHPS